MKIVGEKLLSEKAAALRATLDINSEQRLTQALEMLLSARRIILTGIGASGLVAKDLAYKLLKIGIMAVSETDMHAQLAAVQALDARDLLLAISFSGERREINLAAEEAQRSGAKVLALTSFSLTVCSNVPTIAYIPFRKSQRFAVPRSPQVPRNML